MNLLSSPKVSMAFTANLERFTGFLRQFARARISAQLNPLGFEEKASKGDLSFLKALQELWAIVRFDSESNKVLLKGRICSISIFFVKSSAPEIFFPQ